MRPLVSAEMGTSMQSAFHDNLAANVKSAGFLTISKIRICSICLSHIINEGNIMQKKVAEHIDCHDSKVE